MYDGPERRKMVDEKLQDLQLEVASFTATVKAWMSSTDEYRKHLCDKIDVIKNSFAELPCKERKAWYQGMNRQVAFMWVVITIFIGLVIKDMADRSQLSKALASIQTEIAIKNELPSRQ